MYRSRLALDLAMVAVAAFLIPSSLTAQTTFQRTYGGAHVDIGYSVQQTGDGGYVIAGNTMSFGAGSEDVYVVKTDAAGNAQWTRTYGGANYDGGRSVQQTTDGGYIIAGYTASFGSGSLDIYLIKTDANGDTVWTRTYGGSGEDDGSSVLQTADGGYIIAGYTASFGAGSDDVYLIKTDANGVTLWTRTIGGTGEDGGSSVQPTADSGYIVTGWTVSFGAADNQVLLAKTDAVGDTQWVRQLGRPNSWDGGSSVRQTADGGYIIAGKASSDSTGDDVYLVKTDAAGDTVWTRICGGVDSDGGRSAQQTPDGGYITVGFTASLGAGYCDVYLIRTDASGDTLWTKTIGGPGDEFGYSLQRTTDGGYVIAAYQSPNVLDGRDVYLIKTDSVGYVGVHEPRTSLAPARSLTVTCEPNPCRGAMMVNFQPQAASSEPVTLRMYDTQGRLVHSESGIRVSSFRLDLRSVPAGTYFCRLEAGDNLATAVLLKL